MKRKVLLIISMFAFIFLMNLPTITGISVALLIGVAGSIVCWKSKEQIKKRHEVNNGVVALLISSITILVGMSISFVERWKYSSMVGNIATVLHLPISGFLILISVALAAMSIYFLMTMFDKICDKCLEISQNANGKKWLALMVIMGVMLLQWYQLQYSVLPFGNWEYVRNPYLLFLNYGMCMIPSLILVTLTENWWIALGIGSIACSLFSVVNYYVVTFHGTPIATSELVNFKTAVNVATGYELFVDVHVIFLIGLLVLEMVGVFYLYIIRKESTKRRARLVATGLIIADVLLLYIGLFSSYAVKPAKAIGWSWNEAMMKYGYMTCLIEDFGNTMNPFVEPDNYNSNAIVKVSNEKKDIPEKLPDIILILNETFFDLEIYTDIYTDVDYMETFYSIDNAVYGHAITPSIGGGTNNSEYELLTSNSMALLCNAAPFNYVNLAKSDNNIVKYLERLGYQTYGMHCANGGNYSRSTAYPELGFDNSFLGTESFLRNYKYGNRPWLDSDNYKEMFNLCETKADGSRFMYLLTYQNHGGYEQNDASYDTVHVKNDFGNLTDDVNEYLTSMKISCESFVELTKVLEKSDRKTIVCMVGDHAPSFISELDCKEEFTEEEKNIFSRMAPYVMWTNYDVFFEQNSEYASMVDLVPMMIEQAELPVSDYYRYILDMHEEVPVRTSDQWYMDVDGTIGKYTKDGPYYDLMTQYYYMEYNGLKAEDDYMKELFMP